MKTIHILAFLTAATVAASASTVVVSVPRGASGDQANFSTNSGQTFTTGSLDTDTILSTIALVGPNTAGGTDPVGPFTVKLWTDTDGNATTWDPGTLVASSTNTITIPAANGTVIANFAGGTLSGNTVYLISFSSGASNHVAFRMGLSAAGGTGPLGSTGKLFNNTGSPAFGDNRELAFTVTTVPEPSAALVGGLGILSLLRRRRG